MFISSGGRFSPVKRLLERAICWRDRSALGKLDDLRLTLHHKGSNDLIFSALWFPYSTFSSSEVLFRHLLHYLHSPCFTFAPAFPFALSIPGDVSFLTDGVSRNSLGGGGGNTV